MTFLKEVNYLLNFKKAYAPNNPKTSYFTAILIILAAILALIVGQLESSNGISFAFYVLALVLYVAGCGAALFFVLKAGAKNTR